LRKREKHNPTYRKTMDFFMSKSLLNNVKWFPFRSCRLKDKYDQKEIMGAAESEKCQAIKATNTPAASIIFLRMIILSRFVS
jgi:hypothetical protein